MATLKLDSHFNHGPLLATVALSDKQRLAPYFKQGSMDKRWTFILSDSLKLPRTDCLHLAKPDSTQAQQWLEKIITAGQCRLIVADNLPKAWLNMARLESLAAQYQVTLINLRRPALDNNLVFGPW